MRFEDERIGRKRRHCQCDQGDADRRRKARKTPPSMPDPSFLRLLRRGIRRAVLRRVAGAVL